MKNRKIVYNKTGSYLALLVFVMGFLFTSCEEDIIELQPFNQISETVAFETPEKVELSVIGMYNAAQRGDFNGQGRGYPFGAAFVQQGDNRGEDVVNIAAFYAFTYQGTYSTSSANNVFYWSDTYRLINRANIIADGVDKAAANGIITQAKANEYKAEALLLRAAAYHELLVMFARPFKHTANASHPGVPYHKSPFTTQGAIDEGFATGRHTVAQCYEWILEDLNFAEQHLPLRTSRTNNWRVARGTKTAAAAYKVRIHQHMWNMPGVITEGLKFFEGGVYAGQHSLGAEPWTVFYNNYSNNEYIFGMESTATNYPSVNGALANMYKGRLLVSLSPILWRDPVWLADDKRRNETHMVFNSGGVKFTWKYKDDTNFSDLSPMLRFAEVVLNVAEAYARQNNTTEALKYLNMVRNRALADVAAQAYTATTFANNIDMLGAILKERRIELAMEGRRWPDIHRLQQCPHFPIAGVPAKLDNSNPPAAAFVLDGQPYTGPKAVTAIPYSDHRFVWPIPQNEMNANKAIEQNPGW
jgi:starch-binding outer membrane protein, SusD/RagB family